MQRKKMFTLNLSGIAPDLPFIIFSSIFLIGVVLGCLFVGKFDSVLSDVTDKFNSFFDIRHNDGFLSIFKSSPIPIMTIPRLVQLCPVSQAICLMLRSLPTIVPKNFLLQELKLLFPLQY